MHSYNCASEKNSDTKDLVQQDIFKKQEKLHIFLHLTSKNSRGHTLTKTFTTTHIVLSYKIK